MRKYIGMILLSLTIISCSNIYGGYTHVRVIHKIQEDDPGWDCHTMGNRICGPGHG